MRRNYDNCNIFFVLAVSVASGNLRSCLLLQTEIDLEFEIITKR